jgi:16S rRNA G1207 methylase RsmC
MISQSFEYLNDGGSLLLVVEARIKPWVSRQMKEVFGEAKILKRGPKNVVVMATK